MKYDDRNVCAECFADATLLEYIESEGTIGDCHWCDSRAIKTLPVYMLSEMFRVVVNCYDEVTGPDTYLHFESISFLLQEDWSIFSDKIEDGDRLQEMTLAILRADMDPKERDDFPDYDGFFTRQIPDLEFEWFDKLEGLLKNDQSTLKIPLRRLRNLSLKGIFRFLLNRLSLFKSTKRKDYLEDLPSRLELAIEDGMRFLNAGSTYWRARIHKDRKRKVRFKPQELGAPPPEEVEAARANKTREPVLYLAKDYKTAIAEVRPWRGMAVAVAQVQLKNNIRVLDLTDLRYPYSPFNSEHLCYDLQVLGLLQSFGSALSTPLLPGEEERLYLPSQRLCDFIREHGAEGVLYPSAMGAGSNLVIFDPNAGEPISVEYYRIGTPEFSPEPMHEKDDIYDDWPYASFG